MASPRGDAGRSHGGQQPATQHDPTSHDLNEREADSIGQALPIRPWELAPELPLTDLDAGAPDLTRLQVQLLANRGIHDPAAGRAFLGADWHSASPPLPGVERAVARLRRASGASERVAVFGDYDVDGLTSCATLLLALRAAGIEAEARLPARTDEGRGPSVAAVRELAAQEYTLLATTDCGTTNVEAVQQANELGMEVIITDHHAPQGEVAPALVVINPHQPGCPAPEKQLTGAGVAFRLAEALLAAAPARAETAETELAALLDLVAIGSIGDVAPMTGANWPLVHAGLRRLNLQPRLGLRALIAATKLVPGAITERDVSFVLAPHLNAAGRMGDPLVALRLLITSDVSEAERLAAHLRQLNEERQRVTDEIVAQAREQAAARARSGDALLTVAGEKWPLGVIGLVASRLVEEYARPVAVVSLDDPDCRGSLRGPDGFHLAEALGQRAALLRHFGGHERAAGFTVARSDLEALLAHLRDAAQKHQSAWRAATRRSMEPSLPDVVEVVEAKSPDADQDAPAEPLGDATWHMSGHAEARAPLHIDCRLPLRRVTSETYKALRRLAPFGAGFTEPVFMAPGVRLERAWRSGPEGRTLRLALRDAHDGQRRTALWSRRGELQPLLRGLELVDVAFTLDVDARPGAAPGCLMRVVGVRPA